MGIFTSCHCSAAVADEETKERQEKRKKLLRTVDRNRRLMNESWRQILLMKQLDENSKVVPGLTAFCIEFKKINDTYGELRLNLQSCESGGSPDSACVYLLKHVKGIKIESTQSMNSIRALGRQHATVGKQDRLEQFFSVMLQTLSARLGAAGEGGVMDAWRVHFDAIHKAMMTDKIRLYPELHSLRVSSCSSKHGSVSDAGGAAEDDDDEEGNTRQTFGHMTFRTALDDNKDYAHSADLPRFAIANIHNRDCEILSVAAAHDGAPLATCGPFALEDHAAHEDNTSAQPGSSPGYQKGESSENEGTVLF